MPGLVAAGGRVENHTGAHRRMICGGRAVSRGESKAFAWLAPRFSETEPHERHDELEGSQVAVSARRRAVDGFRLFFCPAFAAADPALGNRRRLRGHRRRPGGDPVHSRLSRDGRAIEVNALGAVAEKIENLEKLAAQISAATNQWAGVQETVHGQAEKTAVAAKAIADRMTNEVIEFSDFMKKMNDTEKATLKLEVEKMRRGEAEWLQVLVHILDHIFALHTAAARSGDVKFTEPIANFQNACHESPGASASRRLSPSRTNRSTPNAIRWWTARKTRRPARSSPRPWVRVTRFRAGFCARRWCGCASRTRRWQSRPKNPPPPPRLAPEKAERPVYAEPPE